MSRRDRNTSGRPVARAAAKYTVEEFYKLKYCSTVVYMVPRA